MYEQHHNVIKQQEMKLFFDNKKYISTVYLYMYYEQQHMLFIIL